MPTHSPVPEHDRPVNPLEVIKEADQKKCKCYGTGIVTRLISMRGDGPITKAAGTIAQEQICGCAMKRFVKKHKVNLVEHQGNLYWAPGKAPALAEEENK